MDHNQAAPPVNANANLPIVNVRDGRRTLRAPRRSWCFTINNPMSSFPLGHEGFISHVKERLGDRLRYIVFQVEQGEHETLHYQGYMELTVPCRFRWLRAVFRDSAHLEPRRGTREQARDYCMKESTRMGGPWEIGDWRSGGQGTRNDLLAVTDLIQTGAKECDVASRFPVAYIKFHAGINKLICLSVPARTIPPVVTLLYGPTGTGKTKYCYDKYPSLYRKPCDTRWFDGYMSDKVLLLDDFGGAQSKMTVLYLLQLLDRYPLLVEAKGKYCPMMAEEILITTNHHPKKWYNWANREESYNALKRRIHKVFYFSEYGSCPLNCSKDTFFDSYQDRFYGVDEVGTYCIAATQPAVEENATPPGPPPQAAVPLLVRHPVSVGIGEIPPSPTDSSDSSSSEDDREMVIDHSYESEEERPPMVEEMNLICSESLSLTDDEDDSSDED